MKKIPFVCFRFYIIPVEYSIFQNPLTEDLRLDLFKKLVLKNYDYSFKRGMEIAIRITNEDDTIFFGKLSKRSNSEIYDKTPTDITENIIDSWPFLSFVCDTTPTKQILLIEYNHKVFQNVLQMKEALTKIAKLKMAASGYTVNFEPIVEKQAFWKIIEDYEYIHSITFKLQSPNMFGASKNARESLKDLQNIFNNTETEIKLTNEEDQLKAPKESLESYQEYADQGGGSWEIVVQQENKKKRFKSDNQSIKLYVPHHPNSENLSREALKQFNIRLWKKQD